MRESVTHTCLANKLLRILSICCELCVAFYHEYCAKIIFVDSVIYLVAQRVKNSASADFVCYHVIGKHMEISMQRKSIECLLLQRLRRTFGKMTLTIDMNTSGGHERNKIQRVCFRFHISLKLLLPYFTSISIIIISMPKIGQKIFTIDSTSLQFIKNGKKYYFLFT